MGACGTAPDDLGQESLQWAKTFAEGRSERANGLAQELPLREVLRAAMEANAEAVRMAVERRREAREIAVAEHTGTAMSEEERQTKALNGIDKEDAYLQVLSGESAQAKQRVEALEILLAGKKEAAAGLENRSAEANAKLTLLGERRDAIEKRNAVLRNNINNMREALEVRAALREREKESLELEIDTLERRAREADISKEELHNQAKRELGQQLAELEERRTEELGDMRRINEKAIAKANRDARSTLDKHSTEFSAKLAEKYTAKIEARKAEIAATRELVAREEETLRSARQVLASREMLQARLEEEEREKKLRERSIQEANADFERAKQALKKLWADNPSLLSLSPDVLATASAARGDRRAETVQALQGFLERQVLPKVELPNQALTDSFKASADQLREIVLSD